jgi:predicted homoserine dehydrogenase-like protein
MSLYQSLLKRHDEGRPVPVALIGAGKFGSMFLSQVPHTPGLEVICDLSPDRAKAACRQVGWDQARISATRFSSGSVTEDLRQGWTCAADRGRRPQCQGFAREQVNSAPPIKRVS